MPVIGIPNHDRATRRMDRASQGRHCHEASGMGVLANDISPIPLMSAHARLVLYMSAVSQSMAFHTADDGFALSALPGFAYWRPTECALYGFAWIL